MKNVLLLAVGTMILYFATAANGNLVIKHGGAVVYSVNPNGELTFNAEVRELSTTLAASTGLQLSRSAVNLLWTTAPEQVNIKGEFIDPVTDTARWIMFRKASTGKRAAVTDEGDIPLSEEGDQNLVAEDRYLDDHIIQRKITGGLVTEETEYCNFGDGRLEYPLVSADLVEKRFFYIKDHLGSARVTEKVDGASASVTEIVSYDAYGAIILSQVSGTEDPTKNKFTGKEYDTSGYIVGGGASGMQLSYFGSRYYDPEIGLWTGTDPAEVDFNTYSYCSGNPINYIDPNGQNPVVIGMLIGLAAGAITGAVVAEATGNEWWQGALIGGVMGAAVGAGIGSAYGWATTPVTDAPVWMIKDAPLLASAQQGTQAATTAVTSTQAATAAATGSQATQAATMTSGVTQAEVNGWFLEDLARRLAANPIPPSASFTFGEIAVRAYAATSPLTNIVVNSPFGAHRNIGTNPHVGVDLSAAIGTEAGAPDAGMIYSNPGSRWNTVTFTFTEGPNQGYQVQYLHMSQRAAGAGRTLRLNAGDPVGLTGDVGIPRGPGAGPHLHLQVRNPAGRIVNPSVIYGGMF